MDGCSLRVMYCCNRVAVYLFGVSRGCCIDVFGVGGMLSEEDSQPILARMNACFVLFGRRMAESARGVGWIARVT